jgi:flagellar biosynthetic protein FliQ
LTFVPKVLAVSAVLIVAGHWMLGQFVGFTEGLFNQIPQLIAGS